MRFTPFILIMVLILSAAAAGGEEIARLEAVRPMTAGDLDVLAAVWSPDGTTLALTEAKHTGIYLMDTATGRMTTLTDEAQAGYRFAWSPDGRQIAYKAVVDDRLMTKVVKLADLETGQITTISGVAAEVGVPVWFPNGRLGFTYQGNFLITDQSGTVLESIAGISSHITALSSDGQWLLYNDGDDRMWAYHLTDGERFQATPDGRRFFNPVWSPSDPVAVINELGGPFYLLDIAAGALTKLDDGNHYAWSPDGERIIYDVTEDDGYRITAAEICTIRPDGTGRTVLTDTEDRLEMYPSWSVTDRIVFTEPDGESYTAQLAVR
jgi:Tol biopolymer transport system component